MMKKQFATTLLITFLIILSQSAPAHANFFLFNLFGGKNTAPTQPPPTHSNNPDVVKLGMHNSEVYTIQQYLIRAKYLNGVADGSFGHHTQQAVMQFQRDSRLTADGVVGPRTMSALKTFKGTRPKVSSPALRRPVYHPPQNNDGVPHYLYTVPMLVTAYTRYDEGCTDYTYRGTYLRRGLCAVDPNVIPLGTRLYVPGYGEAIADDIGGAIQGNHIDLAMDTLDEAFDWGTKNVTIYVLSNV